MRIEEYKEQKPTSIITVILVLVLLFGIFLLAQKTIYGEKFEPEELTKEQIFYRTPYFQPTEENTVYAPFKLTVKRFTVSQFSVGIYNPSLQKMKEVSIEVLGCTDRSQNPIEDKFWPIITSDTVSIASNQTKLINTVIKTQNVKPSFGNSVLCTMGIREKDSLIETKQIIIGVE